MAATASVPAVPVPAGRSRWIRLIPVAIIVYVISFMDRTNIGFAFDGSHVLAYRTDMRFRRLK